MVDWPSNAVAPVPAFVAPSNPAAVADAMAKASRQLEEIFRPEPRKPAPRPSRAGRGFALSPLVDCGLGFFLPAVTGVSTSCFGIEMAGTFGTEHVITVPPGWTGNRCVGAPYVYCDRLNSAYFHNKSCGATAWSPKGVPTHSDALVDGLDVWWQRWGIEGNRPGMINEADRYHRSWSFSIPKAQFTGAVPSAGDFPAWRYRREMPRKPAQKVTGAGRAAVITRPPLTTARRPPKNKRERHSKQSWGAGAFPFRFMLEGTLEGCDMAEQVNSALPVGLRDTSGTCAGQMGAIWEHWVAINWSVALMRIVDNEVEDRFYGAFGRMTKAEAQSVGRPAGLRPKPLGTGPDREFPRVDGAGVRKARNGGWTPCVFCI